MKNVRKILLALATVTFVAGCIYVRYLSHRPVRSARPAAPPDGAPSAAAVSPDAASNDGDEVRLSIREFPRLAIDGFMSDLGALRQRVTEQRDVVVANVKLADERRHRRPIAPR